MSARSKRMTREEKHHRRLMIRQKVFAIFLILIAIAFGIIVTMSGEDCGGALVVGALGLYLLFTREVWFY